MNTIQSSCVRLCPLQISRCTIMLILTMALSCIFTSCASKSEISEAADSGNLEKVKALIKDNPKLVFNQDIYGDTPLHFATTKEVAELLIANGASVNATDKWGNTPLHLAASGGHMDVISCYWRTGRMSTQKLRQ